MKRAALAVVALTLAMGMVSTSPASARTEARTGPRYHELACSVNGLAPRLIFSPKRVQGRGEVTCTNSGSVIDRVVVWTSLQWFCCTETQIQTIAINKRTFNDVASGRTLRTAATRLCDPSDVAFAYLYRTKVVTWVYDSYGDLRLKETDFTPGGGTFKQVGPCGDEDGFQ